MTPYSKDEIESRNQDPLRPLHQISNGWAFFAGFGTRDHPEFWGAFLTIEGSWPDIRAIHVYHNANDDDLPITAVLIPY